MIVLFASWGAEYEVSELFKCSEWGKVRHPVVRANTSAGTSFRGNGCGRVYCPVIRVPIGLKIARDIKSAGLMALSFRVQRRFNLHCSFG